MARKCRGSWLDTYLEYTSNQESPTAFHEWVGISILSAAIGRNIWIPRIKYTIFPNLFVILVAGSARCRKSVSIGIGIDILKGVKDPPMIFAQKITTEALIQALEGAKVHGASSGLVCASELSVFMGTDVSKSGIIPTLTDLYDSPKEWIYHTRGRGKEILRNVTLSILAATTKEWLKSSIPESSIGGGFTSRIIFVYQDRPSKLILFPEENVFEERLRSDLIFDLEYIKRTLKGPLDFTIKAKELAEAWYEEEFQMTRDTKLDGYFARKHDIMFKIASLLSASESSTRTIEHTHINKALFMLEENERNLEAIIASVVATAVGGETEKILEIVKTSGEIAHSELLRKCWRFASAADVNQMLKTLLESKEIVELISKDGRSRSYRVKKRR